VPPIPKVADTLAGYPHANFRITWQYSGILYSRAEFGFTAGAAMSRGTGRPSRPACAHGRVDKRGM